MRHAICTRTIHWYNFRKLAARHKMVHDRELQEFLTSGYVEVNRGKNNVDQHAENANLVPSPILS